MQGKAEDAGILTYVKDDNTAPVLPGALTCLDICLVCYKNKLKVLIKLFQKFAVSKGRVGDGTQCLVQSSRRPQTAKYPK